MKKQTQKMKSLSEQIEERVGKALQDCLSNIPHQIKSQVNQIVAKALGFECRYGNEWNVDHCNGRNSTVSSLVCAAAQKQVEEVVRKASEEFVITDDQIEAIKNDMRNRFRDAMYKAVGDKLEQIAAAKAVEVVNELMPDFTKISTDIKKMADPSYGSKEIEQVAMMAHALMNGEEFEE